MDAATKNKKRMCVLCNVRCITRRDKAVHFTSQFHKFMLSIKRTQQSYIKDTKTLKDQIAETGKREAFIGLEYIYEYAEDSNGYRMYECKLCDSPFHPDNIYFHIVGIQHRTLYLGKHHPIMGIWTGFEVQNQANYRKLNNSAFAIEQTHGRKKINVVDEVYVPKPYKCDESDSESASEAEPKEAKQVNNKTKKKRLARSLAKLKAKYVPHDHNEDARSMPLESYCDEPRFQLPYDDFDARALHPMPQHDLGDNANPQGLDGAWNAHTRYHDVGSVYQSDNRDIPEFFQGGMAMPYGAAGGNQMLPDYRGGAQRGMDNFPPYPPAVPFGGSALPHGGGGPQRFQDVDFRGGGPSYPPERPFPPLPGVGGLVSRDDFEDVDFRRMNIHHGGHSAFLDKDPNRRRMRSPDPHGRRRRSRFEDSCGDVDVRSVLPTGGISFRELKAAHDGNPHGGFSSAHLPLCKKKKKMERDTDSDMEVCSMEFSDCDPEDFWCNEELLDYVKTYEIQDDEGARFVLQAMRMMADALVRHRAKKQDLQKRILEEKQKLEEEKKEFFEIKKRKEKSIYATHLRSSEPQNIKLFQKVTGTDLPGPSNPPAGLQAAQKPQEKAGPTTAKVTQPQPKTPVSAPATAVKPPVQKPQASKNNEPKPLTNFQKALVDGIISASPKPKGLQSEPMMALSSKALLSGLGPVLQELFERSQRSGTGSSQNPPISGSRFDNPNPRPVTGPAAGGYSGSSQNPPISGSRFDNPNPRPVTGPAAGGYSGSGTSSSQNPPISGSRFDNPNPRPVTGPAGGGYSGPNNTFYEDQPFPGSWVDNSGSMDKTKAPIGAGSETRLSQNPKIPDPRFDNPNPSKDPRLVTGQAAGGYSGSGKQMSGSRFDNQNPTKEMRPPMGQAAGAYSGPETRFDKTAQSSGSRFDNPNPSQEMKPLAGQAAGAYSEPMSWSSGGQTGNQGFYKETPSPAPGVGAGRYAEEYIQNQWQSQYNNRGGYGSGPQSQQPPGPSGFSSDRPQGTWSSQEPTMSTMYPRSILKNRTGNLP